MTMLTLHPQYITDTTGEKLIALPVNEFNSIMEELEDMEDVRLYDTAKKEDDGTRVLFADYLKERIHN
jgi:PHD/YefM family antitoxin component YafN of YafNO toxin-antitoxin module